MTASPLGTDSALALSYYQPWVYAGSERYHQLAREELRQGRSLAYVYTADAGGLAEIEGNVKLDEYARLALYRMTGPQRVTPQSPYAAELTGDRSLSLPDLVALLRPGYVRAHFPVADFVPALESAPLRRQPFLYDVIDLWDDFVATPWGDSAVERYYFQRADALPVVSRSLADRLPGANTQLVPNAVDRLFLRRIAPAPGVPRRPAGAAKRVLYMGSMGGSWFDWDLVCRLPRELPDHRFTFLGSWLLPPEEKHDARVQATAERIAQLSAYPNVELIPEVPHDDIAPWLWRCDVGLIPFHATDLVTAVSPLKVYEYLGAGAVVVQRGMPDIEGYPGVRTAGDADEFVKLVAASDAAETTAEELAAMARFCEDNTWRARVAQFDAIAASIGDPGQRRPPEVRRTTPADERGFSLR